MVRWNRGGTRERDFLSKSETHEKHGLSADLFFLFPSSSTFFLRATSTPLFPSCDESGTRSDSHEGQDEIKDRRCRSRDNDPVLTEDDPRIVHLSSVSIKRLGSSTARKPETRWRSTSNTEGTFSSLPVVRRFPSTLMLSYPLNPYSFP